MSLDNHFRKITMPPITSFSCRGISLLCLAIAGGLTGCSSTPPLHEVSTQHEAGNSYVAVTYVEPWDKVSAELKPKFDMPSGEAALGKVIPQTSIALNRLLNATSIGVGLGFGGTTNTSTVTTDQTMGQPASTQIHSVQQTSPGEATQPNQTAPSGSAKDLPGTDALGKTLAQEPTLQYAAALALFQEVQLLNRYVDGAPNRKNYTPYLVRLQVTLVPYAKNEPYDGYTNISFFMKEQANSSLPIVIPLVVTDSLEGTLTSSTNETVRQFALALGGIVQNAQAKAALQNLADELHSTSGIALNSLQTIGRSSDNSIQVRFGAQRDPNGTDRYVMVPRTHNVTLLLLVPKASDNRKTGKAPEIEGAKNKDAQSKDAGCKKIECNNPACAEQENKAPETDNGQTIQLTSLTRFYHVTKGTLLDPVNAKAFKAEVKNKLSFYDLKAPINDEQISNLISDVGDNNYSDYDEKIQCFIENKNDQKYLWNDLTIFASSYGYAGTTFELPQARTTPPPQEQTALLTDDGDSATTTHLIGGHQLSSGDLFAILEIGKNPSPLKLAARSISVTEDDLALTFPSLAKLGVTPSDEANAHIHLSIGSDETKRDYTYCVFPSPTPPAKVDAGFKIGTSVTTIPVDTDHSGQLSTYLTFAKDGADKVEITAQGSEIKSASAGAHAPAGSSITLSGGVVTVSGKAGSRIEVILGLNNALDGKTLKLSATGYKAGKKTDTATQDISLMDLNMRWHQK